MVVDILIENFKSRSMSTDKYRDDYSYLWVMYFLALFNKNGSIHVAMTTSCLQNMISKYFKESRVFVNLLTETENF